MNARGVNGAQSDGHASIKNNLPRYFRRDINTASAATAALAALAASVAAVCSSRLTTAATASISSDSAISAGEIAILASRSAMCIMGLRMIHTSRCTPENHQ